MPGASLVNVIAVHATNSTAHPTAASAGSNIAQATWAAAGFVTIGKVDDVGNDIDLDEDTMEPTWIKEFATIRPPRGNAPSDKVLMSHRVEPFEFSCYGVPQNLFALDSNANISSNKFGTTNTVTKRTVVVEINGIGLLWIPIAIVTTNIKAVGFAGDGGVARGGIMVDPLRHATHTTGAYFQWYV